MMEEFDYRDAVRYENLFERTWTPQSTGKDR